MSTATQSSRTALTTARATDEVTPSDRILFWSGSPPPWNRLSTFAGPAVFQGRRASSWEAHYQSARFSDYPEVQAFVLQAHNGADARHRAMRFAELSRKDWREARFEVMENLIEARFKSKPSETGVECNPDLILLKSSGQAELILLSSWGDLFWGWCGRGENYYGRLLMGRRHQRSGDALAITPTR